MNVENLSVEDLFKTRGVAELQSLSREFARLQDGKREELRTMVGEGYRQILEAADTIIGMKVKADELHYALQNIQESSSRLRSKVQHSEFALSKNKKNLNTDMDPGLMSNLALAAEVDILMVTPELIWKASEEDGDLLSATKLFLLARHVHTHLSLMKNEEHNAFHWFPVLSRQWESLSRFHASLSDKCVLSLTNAYTNDHVIVDNMAALLLLKDMSCEQMFELWLKLRRQRIQADLKRARKNDTVRVMIEQCIESIKLTVLVVAKAFLFNGQESMANSLKLAAEPAIHLLRNNISPVHQFLPPLAKDFSPVSLASLTTSKNSTLDSTLLSSKLTSWLDALHSQVVHETKEALIDIDSVEKLAKTRSQIHLLLISGKGISRDEWMDISSSVLNGKALELWSEFYQAVFVERAEAIVAARFEGCIGSLHQIVFDEDDVNKDNLTELMWQENISRALITINEKTQGDKEEEDTKLSSEKAEMLAKGYSPTVQKLCEQLEKQLSVLLSDVSAFTAPSSKLEIDLGVTNDAVALMRNLEETTKRFVDKLIQICEEARLSGKWTEVQVLGRFLQALPEKCPHLEQCLSASLYLKPKEEAVNSLFDVSSLTSRRVKSDPRWLEIRNRLETESNALLTAWIEVVVEEKVLKLLLDQLKFNDTQKLLRFFPVWEEHEITEEGDDNAVVNSVIRVPHTCSIPLAEALALLCDRIYDAAPHTLLSPSVQQSLCNKLCLSVSEAYENCLSQNRIGQRLALQLRFDLLCVLQAFVPRDSDPEISRRLNGMVQNLETHIDPFDLNVFAAYINDNVKKFVLRHSGLLSALIPSERFAVLASLKSSLMSTTATSGKRRTPHVLWLTESRPKLSLLPVARSTGVTMNNSLFASTNKSERVGNNRSPTPARNTFLEVVRGGWFGSHADNN